jgi:hypothetical protein
MSGDVSTGDEVIKNESTRILSPDGHRWWSSDGNAGNRCLHAGRSGVDPIRAYRNIRSPAPTSTITPNPIPTITPNPTPTRQSDQESTLAKIALVKTGDRAAGVRRVIELLGINPIRGNRVLLKPNLNSADAAPGSTHPEVLRTLVTELYDMGAQTITLADRSGMGDTRVSCSRPADRSAQELGFSYDCAR